MSDILSIGAGATQLYRQSLATVSNNIANLNTEGYSRQEATSAEGMPSQQGTVYIGTGARLEGVTRAYDEFVETSLRNSGSDLATQEPLIQYANRIVDMMGSQTSGLSNALDQFFATASNLSADPASNIQRDMFLRDADSLASRFREISGHLGAIQYETQSSIELQVTTINTLSQQLSTVNAKLGGKISADKQPPGLLDQRDQILRDLSDISRVHITESPAGGVSVRLGSSSGTLIVDGKDSTNLGVSFDANNPGKVDIIADPYGTAYAASTVTNGLLGGLINFRNQTLAPAMNSFDYLAQTVVKEVNQIHTSGLDGRGERGKALFKIDSVFEITAPTIKNQAAISIEVVDPDAFKFSSFEMRWMETDKVWRIQDGTSKAVTFAAPGAEGFTHAGLQIKAVGAVNDGDTYLVTPSARPAAGFRLALTDSMTIAASERLRPVGAEANIGDSKVALLYDQTSDFTGFKSGTDITSLGNNMSTAAGVATAASNIKPAFIIPKGSDNVSLMMEVPQDSTLSFQVMTHEGLHVLGHSINTATQAALMSGDAGFSASNSYSSTYLNTAHTGGVAAIYRSALTASVTATLAVSDGTNTVSLASATYADVAAQVTAIQGAAGYGDLAFTVAANSNNIDITYKTAGAIANSPTVTVGGSATTVTTPTAGVDAVNTSAYMDLDMTYGFLENSIQHQGFVANATNTGMVAQTTTTNAQVVTAPVRLQENVSGSTVDLIAANSLVLNGHNMSALTLATGNTSSAAAMATWLNSANDSTGVTATASNVIRSAATSINLTQQVKIEGVLIGGSPPYADIHALSAAINNETSTTHVVSYVGREGDLVITNAAGYEGANIALSNPDASSSTNALGQANQTYIGTLNLDSPSQIRFTFGANGVPADLAVLGLRTGIYIDSSTDEDLAVFVTGTGSANIAAGFTPPPVANKLANEQPFSIDFVSATQYTITDTTTGTVVATRAHVAGDDIDYQTLSLTFDTDPLAGDRFVVDGNKDGIGNNTNMLLLVALQDKPVLSNGRTIRDGYIDIVSTVGNKATLGKISQEALQVVYDQANASRDQVSGVSLDEEAADLIRYQQAYQASAQIIQMASKLFDSILGIR